MTSRAVKLTLIIHDHLDNSVSQYRCLNAKFDNSLGYLRYDEEDSNTSVSIDFIDDSYAFKRLGADQTHILLKHHQFSTFSVGTPAVQGTAWLQAYTHTQSTLTLHYQLYLNDEMITDRTMVYTITEADA
jgi:hypothetical protein